MILFIKSKVNQIFILSADTNLNLTRKKNVKPNNFDNKFLTMADLLKMAFDQLDPIYKNNAFRYHDLGNLKETHLSYTGFEYDLMIIDIQLIICDLFLNGYREVGVSCSENQGHFTIFFHCAENPENILYKIRLNKAKNDKKKMAA